MHTPKFQEEYSAKLPALVLLAQLGWQFMPPSKALVARQNNTSTAILREALHEQLKKRRFIYKGEHYPLSEKSIDHIIATIATPALNEGLIRANEKIYNHLLYGLSVTEFINGKKVTPTIALIDWVTPQNNSFLFTEEFTVANSQHTGNRRPDIVCFVNGIPWVVIEAKRPDGKKGPTIEEGISQSLRNQRLGEIPLLFSYSQLLLSINGLEGRYATCNTPAKFWASWREEDITAEQMHTLKNKALNTAQKALIFSERKAEDRTWYESWSSKPLAVTDQDMLLTSLLTPARLLEMTRLFTLFDKKHGKIIARHQQVFGIKRLLERITQKSTAGARNGGVVWHTTGSGKSFTMVFFSKALILNDALKQCRIVVVTDRKDLETQLSTTFISGGEVSGKKDMIGALATSGRRLAEQIGHGTERVIFSLIQKFNTATRLPECRNDSSNLIVLVDEGHRSHGGENHTRMKLALPNAAFVAFTGTPLLKQDKTTNKFGPIVHAYTMQRAVEDKTVTPLLYEERKPELAVNEKAIDTWFDRITEGATNKQKSDLKRKFSQKGNVYQAEDRIHLIALDIANHFNKNIHASLKGQLACDSKLSAVRYKKYLDEAGLFESAIVMSAPDTREGNSSTDESSLPEVTAWWKENVGKQDETAYAKQVIARFASDPTLKLLIVVDKLLTGFDEPANTVLYIDKPLKSHNLIQAIARVNRLHEHKDFGLLVDYRGILKELDATIAKYHDLEERTLGGFDIDDIQGLYHNMSVEYKKLPMLHNELWAFFDKVENKQDIEQLRRILVPKMEERNNELTDIHQKTREDFYETLSEFARCMKIAFQSAEFFTDPRFNDNDRQCYKETLKQLSFLRQIVRQDAGETVSFDVYSDDIKKLMDKHVAGIDIKTPEGIYDVRQMGTSTNPEQWSDEKTRNETDTIKTRVAKTIEQSLNDDPYAQKAFSELLKKTINEAEKLFDHPLKQYMLFQQLETQVTERKLDSLPDVFNGNRHAQAYFGLFKQQIPALLNEADSHTEAHWVSLAFSLSQQVDSAVAENSINPQNIEANIRKRLLPLLFKECKAVGYGINHASQLVEHVVQITRVGLNTH